MTVLHEKSVLPAVQDQVEIFKRLYPHTKNSELARRFGCQLHTIKNLAARLNLSKSKEHMQAVAEQTRFEPGHAAWNKGKSYPTTGRAPETQFKKGQKPSNWLPIGSERVTEDGYLQRKMTDTGVSRNDFVQLHHLVWLEQTGQKVPKGHALIFKDGNKRNFEIDNLELLTRADLMRRNSVHTLPPDIKAQCMVLGGFNRKLRRIEREQSNG